MSLPPKQPRVMPSRKSTSNTAALPVIAEQEKSPKVRGRPRKPTAISRNPDWKPWTGYLKRETVADAEHMLKRNPAETRGMSELLEDLLSGWLAEQKRR